MITILIQFIGEILTKKSFAHLDRSVIHVGTNSPKEALERCAAWLVRELNESGEDAKDLGVTPEDTITVVARGREEFMHIAMFSVCPVVTIPQAEETLYENLEFKVIGPPLTIAGYKEALKDTLDNAGYKVESEASIIFQGSGNDTARLSAKVEEALWLRLKEEGELSFTHEEHTVTLELK